jgi:hypothetical protein
MTQTIKDKGVVVSTPAVQTIRSVVFVGTV